MGVTGLTALLREHGYMPPHDECGCPLWHEVSMGDNMANNLVRIPTGSVLAIDGDGLAYHLHTVAYTRYYHGVTNTQFSSSQQSKFRCNCPRNLSKEQVTRCLPQSMPLSEIHDVTTEFITKLREHGLSMKLFWDGPRRRFKAATSQKRHSERACRWNNLHQYCLNGTLPVRRPCQKDFRKQFPVTRLLQQQVIATIRLMRDASIEMITCVEEADRFVAQASADDPNCYCVGLDSDFCLFPRTKYIPLTTLNIAGPAVMGCLITRTGLAEEFHLPSDESMVELALTVGNDYVLTRSEKYIALGDTIETIRSHGEAYRVISKDRDVQRAIEFSRALYNFGDLSDFPFDESNTKTEEAEKDNEKEIDDTHKPTLPQELDFTLANVTNKDQNVADVVFRTLQAYIWATGASQGMMNQSQLDTWYSITSKQQSQQGLLAVSFLSAPYWSEIQATYILERCIHYVFSTSTSSLAVQQSSPMKLFDWLSFHLLSSGESRSVQKAQEATLPKNHMGHNSKENMNKSVPKPSKPIKLPIDDHEEEILDAVEKQRVTIIHGETGCGKSSRVPVMLLRAPPPGDSSEVKMFVSQPRRIAAKSLVERVRNVEPDLKHKIALRMGHGVKEYESNQTKIYFVTTGYLVRLLANHPEKFKDHSHLIIDEVHERSVDTDILCLLCRRLLSSNKGIRLVLMSATLAATLYQQYFGIPEPPIYVGSRRFSITEYFIEDFKVLKFPPNLQKACDEIKRSVDNSKCKTAPGRATMENMHAVAVKIATSVGKPGSSVLIFVPGMNEIISIMDLVEKVYQPGMQYICIPIHSDVPFEEQMTAFDNPGPSEIKIVIATNAAESSITLPDVDHVICLGLCKQIEYNPASHRQLLTSAWISRASAVQRAGRTGRVREGNVYRLYPKLAFDNFMDKHEIGEMKRIPLDQVILGLKEILNEAATPVLMDCLEPPDISTVERSLENLHKSKFISMASDEGKITRLGAFVSTLGIDLTLGSLIGLGIQYGVGSEAIEMAAILSFPQPPWIMTNPFFHEHHEYNEKTVKTFMSRCQFDAGLYSEPLATMNLMWDYENCSDKNKFIWKFGLHGQRLRRLIATRNSLRNRVAGFVGVDPDAVAIEEPPSRLPHAKIVLLRIIQVWVFHESVIESQQVLQPNSNGSIPVTLRGNAISDKQLDQILDHRRHKRRLITNEEIEQSGKFTLLDSSTDDFEASFGRRLFSFSAEKGIPLMWYWIDEKFHLVARKDVAESPIFTMFRNEGSLDGCTEVYVQAVLSESGTRRGIQERACGLWDIKVLDGDSTTDGISETNTESVPAQSTPPRTLMFVHFSSFEGKTDTQIGKFLKIKSLQVNDVDRSLSCRITSNKSERTKNLKSFSFFLRGSLQPLSVVDLHDMFATSAVESKTRKSDKATQQVSFELRNISPMPFNNKFLRQPSFCPDSDSDDWSWKQPLLRDIPEGARLLSVLASAHRNNHVIFFEKVTEEGGQKNSQGGGQTKEFFKVELSRSETRIGERWKRFASEKAVYVNSNCVPAAAVNVDGPTEFFAVAADALEVKGGGLRVQGISLLPAGREFLLLSFLTFGLHPFPFFRTEIDDEDIRELEFDQCLNWLVEGPSEGTSQTGLDGTNCKTSRRIREALSFNKQCVDIGEELVCYPELVATLLSIFDGIDGYDCHPWSTLWQNPFTDATSRETIDSDTEYRVSADPKPSDTPSQSNQSPSSKKITMRAQTKKKKKKKAPNQDSLRHSGRQLTPKGKQKLTPEFTACKVSLQESNFDPKSLFATHLDEGETIEESGLYTTNLLALLVENAFGSLAPIQEESQWEIFEISATSKMWFAARWIGDLTQPVRSSDSPDWMLASRPIPKIGKTAMECLPPEFVGKIQYRCVLASINHREEMPQDEALEVDKFVAYSDVATALRMAAAYWLERQFFDGRTNRHWYHFTFPEMLEAINGGIASRAGR